jgi:tRNA-Thr(GGU) m(6)t(6)A37 methyltransferase TsaA
MFIEQSLVSIGTARTPYKTHKDAPRQGRIENSLSTLEILPRFETGLDGLEAFSHLIVLYWQHMGDRDKLRTATPSGPEVRGVFATRSPNRPNPIGLCVVELVDKCALVLTVRGMDALDESAILDIKPYISELDSVSGAGRRQSC